MFCGMWNLFMILFHLDLSCKTGMVARLQLRKIFSVSGQWCLKSKSSEHICTCILRVFVNVSVHDLGERFMERLCSLVCWEGLPWRVTGTICWFGRLQWRSVSPGMDTHTIACTSAEYFFFFSTIRKTKAEIKSERCVRVYAVDILQKCMGNVLNSIHSLLWG